jgi:hypothetical protein
LTDVPVEYVDEDENENMDDNLLANIINSTIDPLAEIDGEEKVINNMGMRKVIAKITVFPLLLPTDSK